MANSSTVAAGDTATATQYNNLRKDVLEHTHNGTDSAVCSLATTTVFSEAMTRYYRVSVFDVVHNTPTTGFSRSPSMGLRCLNSDENIFLFPVHLPNGAVVTSFKVNWVNTDASGIGEASLAMDLQFMATANSTAGSGTQTVEDTSISYATIDNTSHDYFGYLKIDKSGDAGEVAFMWAVITYTVLAPLP